MADSGEITDLSMARAYQTQKVLPKVKKSLLKNEHKLKNCTKFSGLPPGFKLTDEILNAEKPSLPPPPAIHYTEKHVSNIDQIINIEVFA